MMKLMAGPDYILDIHGVRREHDDATHPQPGDKGAFSGRPWISVHWRCCGVYSRIYRNHAGTAYEGRCPRCGSPVKATVGPGGTANRFFEAG